MRPHRYRVALTVSLLLLAGCGLATTRPVAAPAPATATPTPRFSAADGDPQARRTATRAALVGTPATTAPRANCPVTPYAPGPPTDSEGDRAIGGLRPYRWYGGDGLWAFPWLYGEPPGALYVDDRGYHKVLWWREPGVQGGLTVTARRLDGPTAPIDVDFEGNSTQQGQQPGGLRFPTTGCWELTGTAGGKHLTIVALVMPAPATPGSVRTQASVATTGASRAKSGERHGGSGRHAGVGTGARPQSTGQVGKFKPVTAAWAEF